MRIYVDWAIFGESLDVSPTLRHCQPGLSPVRTLNTLHLAGPGTIRMSPEPALTPDLFLQTSCVFSQKCMCPPEAHMSKPIYPC